VAFALGPLPRHCRLSRLPDRLIPDERRLTVTRSTTTSLKAVVVVAPIKVFVHAPARGCARRRRSPLFLTVLLARRRRRGAAIAGGRATGGGLAPRRGLVSPARRPHPEADARRRHRTRRRRRRPRRAASVPKVLARRRLRAVEAHGPVPRVPVDADARPLGARRAATAMRRCVRRRGVFFRGVRVHPSALRALPRREILEAERRRGPPARGRPLARGLDHAAAGRSARAAPQCLAVQGRESRQRTPLGADRRLLALSGDLERRVAQPLPHAVQQAVRELGTDRRETPALLQEGTFCLRIARIVPQRR